MWNDWDGMWTWPGVVLVEVDKKAGGRRVVVDVGECLVEGELETGVGI